MGTVCPPGKQAWEVLGWSGHRPEKGKLRSEDGFFTTELSTCPESTAGSQALEAAGLSGRRQAECGCGPQDVRPRRPPVGAQHGQVQGEAGMLSWCF